MDQKLYSDCNHELIVCTFAQCDQNSRYLCKSCRQNHLHNQENDQHIMRLSDLCKYILNLISKHNTQNIILERWREQLKKGSQTFDTHTEYGFFENYFVDGYYQYVCKQKADMLYQLLKNISEDLSQFDNKQICVLCFEETNHDHQEIVNIFQAKENIIIKKLQDNSDEDFYEYFYEYFRDSFEGWQNQKPTYSRQRISFIQSILSYNQQVSDDTLNRLVLLKNRTLNLNKFWEIIKGETDRQLKRFDKKNQKISKISNIKYYNPQAPKTLQYQVWHGFAQFLISPNQSDFIHQDNNKNILIGEINTGYIKYTSKLMNRIMIMKFSTDMNHLFCGDSKGFVMGFQTKNYKLYYKRKFHKTLIRTLEPIKHNEIISYSDDQNLKITNYKTNKILLQIKYKEDFYKNRWDQEDEIDQIQHSIVYDDTQQIIYIGYEGIQVQSRRTLKLKEERYQKNQITIKLQLINNNADLLSADSDGLKQWTLVKFKLFLIKQYNVNIISFRQINDERIILMGVCFIEILNGDFERVKLELNNNCPISKLNTYLEFLREVKQRKFQIEQPNSCYFISIFEKSINIEKRIIDLQT